MSFAPLATYLVLALSRSLFPVHQHKNPTAERWCVIPSSFPQAIEACCQCNKRSPNVLAHFSGWFAWYSSRSFQAQGRYCESLSAEHILFISFKLSRTIREQWSETAVKFIQEHELSRLKPGAWSSCCSMSADPETLPTKRQLSRRLLLLNLCQLRISLYSTCY